MFNTEKLSLAGLLGGDYISALLESVHFYGRISDGDAERAAYEEIDLYPRQTQEADERLYNLIGKRVTGGFANDNTGAATDAFAHAFHGGMAPVGAGGCTRIGEDGRLYLLGKSEHYHASLGHSFPGYRLIDNARLLGIPNATHNNTRGYITRLCERQLIKAANGREDIGKILASKDAGILNRVINLETGSVAAEAGVKLMLDRFYRLDGSYDTPQYAGKTPVFLVMGDYSGTLEANYHGTSVLTQTMRGMWPELYGRLEESGLFKVVPVAINDIEAFERTIRKYNSGKYKTAGFIAELVMMNYGAVRLDDGFIKRAYELCRELDTPCMVDEIQTGMWYREMFMFRRYKIKPDIVILGKGFPGGEYPASKLLTTAPLDSLNQFGALVTNGQEELASLAYLITMRFNALNGEIIEENGDYFRAGLDRLAEKYRSRVTKIEGDRLLAAITFGKVEDAASLAKRLNSLCIDASAQLYKAHCPPAVLFKPPLTASKRALELIIKAADTALSEMTEG